MVPEQHCSRWSEDQTIADLVAEQEDMYGPPNSSSFGSPFGSPFVQSDINQGSWEDNNDPGGVPGLFGAGSTPWRTTGTPRGHFGPRFLGNSRFGPRRSSWGGGPPVPPHAMGPAMMGPGPPRLMRPGAMGPGFYPLRGPLIPWRSMPEGLAVPFRSWHN